MPKQHELLNAMKYPRFEGTTTFMRLPYITDLTDVNFVDPAYAPGTGIPDGGGFRGHVSTSFVHVLADINFVGFDMVEVTPCYDPAKVAGLLAANIICEFITLIALSKKIS